MPRRPSNRRSGVRMAKRRQRHLYLVMDDWISGPGYRICKADLSSDWSDDDSEQPLRQITAVSDDDKTGQRLPTAVLRLKLPSIGFFAAFGTKIVVSSMGAAHIFDIRKRCLGLGPQPNRLPNDIYVSVGDKLLALGDGSTQLLCTLDDWEWSWRKLPKPPFKKERVRSHAVHPDQRTIYVCTESGTFTLDTKSFKWKQHSKWKLPFTGDAHFDSELDAWIGLSGDPDTFGYLCSCDVATDAGASHGQPLAWKLNKEKLFNKNPAETQVGAKLVYIGGRSKFCLVECISIDDDGQELVEEEELEEKAEQDRPCRHLLRITTFSLKYGKNGDLLTARHIRVRSYRMPVADMLCCPLTMVPVAFWM